ncbi:MAG: RNA methyltransferase [Thermoanaerobacteraceae bacterium]|nr:RNA methyltransferase [Thermoanaerobacteraceae bacterium]MBE3589124.1 RNA methyltransferase [Thermoanaerobacteraceae bacterium]
MEIKSHGNNLIKYVRRLSRRRQRDKEGRFLLEGVRLVQEALSSGWPVEMLLYTGGVEERIAALLERARQKGIRTVTVAEKLLGEITDTVTPQGVLAVVKKPAYILEELFLNAPTLLVLVEGVADPGNLGTIIRSADAAGAGGVVLLPGTVDLYNPKTIRSTMGSLFHLPVVPAGEAELLSFLHSSGIQVVAGVPRGGIPLWAVDLTRPTALLVGGEAAGISTPWRDRAAHLAVIPMPGRAESLNVAAAASIMLYEAVRQRQS